MKCQLCTSSRAKQSHPLNVSECTRVIGGQLRLSQKLDRLETKITTCPPTGIDPETLRDRKNGKSSHGWQLLSIFHKVNNNIE